MGSHSHTDTRSPRGASFFDERLYATGFLPLRKNPDPDETDETQT